MGMYTELNLGVCFIEKCPQNVIDILKYMLDNDLPAPMVPNHPLFKTSRWDFMLVCDSCYFDSHVDSSIQYKDYLDQYYLNVRCNLKNYDQEIEHFLNFIQPYLETEGFLGYMRYEEDDDPTLIYNTENGIELFKIDVEYYDIKGVTL